MTSVEALHEVAHAVVAVRLRLRLVQVSISPTAVQRHRDHFEPAGPTAPKR